eukprot:3064331-Prymnesium_polylepis.1
MRARAAERQRRGVCRVLGAAAGTHAPSPPPSTTTPPPRAAGPSAGDARPSPLDSASCPRRLSMKLESATAVGHGRNHRRRSATQRHAGRRGSWVAKQGRHTYDARAAVGAPRALEQASLGCDQSGREHILETYGLLRQRQRVANGLAAHEHRNHRQLLPRHATALHLPARDPIVPIRNARRRQRVDRITTTRVRAVQEGLGVHRRDRVSRHHRHGLAALRAHHARRLEQAAHGPGSARVDGTHTHVFVRQKPDLRGQVVRLHEVRMRERGHRHQAVQVLEEQPAGGERPLQGGLHERRSAPPKPSERRHADTHDADGAVSRHCDERATPKLPGYL